MNNQFKRMKIDEDVPLTQREQFINPLCLNTDQDKCLDDFFTNVQQNLQKNSTIQTQTQTQTLNESHSIGCGSNDNIIPTHSQSTDARDMVKHLTTQKTAQNSFGCNTDTKNTSEK